MRGITTVQDIRDVINSLNITLFALEEGEGPSIGNTNFHIKATREQVTELKRVMRIYGPVSIRFHYFTYRSSWFIIMYNTRKGWEWFLQLCKLRSKTQFRTRFVGK